LLCPVSLKLAGHKAFLNLSDVVLSFHKFQNEGSVIALFRMKNFLLEKIFSAQSLLIIE
jgi:hypothetical protein